MNDSVFTLLALTMSICSIGSIISLIEMVTGRDQDRREAALVLFLLVSLILATCILVAVKWPTLPQAIHAAMPEAAR
jgi:hypothetical protein